MRNTTRSSAPFDRGDDSPEGQLTDDVLDAMAKFERAKVTEITPASKFYRAEEYHQRYFEKHRLARFFMS